MYPLFVKVFAWEVADQLLLLRRNRETSYFAAQTMQSKVRFSFEELPSEIHTVRHPYQHTDKHTANTHS